MKNTATVAWSQIFLMGLAHLYVFCKGGNSCSRHRDFHLGLIPLIDCNVSSSLKA
jgi:hypothetical protein